MSKNRGKAADFDAEEEELDISEILAPPSSQRLAPIKKNTGKEQKASDLTAEDSISENKEIEGEAEQNFVQYHSHPRPLIENQLEYFSSEEERITVSAPRLPDLSGRKAAQKRMRLIILVDIVLFLVILGVIYPSLYKLQTRGKLSGYRFSIEQSRDAQGLNILVKTERLLSSKSQATQYQIRIFFNDEEIYQNQRELPSLDSPVSYALFPLAKPSPEPQDFDIIIRVGQEEKKFFLSVDAESQEG